MNSKAILATITVVVLVGAGLGYFFVMPKGTDMTSVNSGNDTPSSEASARKTFDDACRVVAKEDVEAAFGSVFKNGEKEDGSTSSDGLKGDACTYKPADDSATGQLNGMNFTVKIENFKSSGTAAVEMKAIRSTAKLGSKVYFIETPVAGVGDDAFFFQGQAPAALKSEEFMYVRKGSQIFHFVAVQLSGIDHAKAKVALTALAKKALND